MPYEEWEGSDEAVKETIFWAGLATIGLVVISGIAVLIEKYGNTVDNFVR